MTRTLKRRSSERTALLFLPPYSPELMPTERPWCWMKEYDLSNRVFADEVEIDAACKENRNRLSPNESDPSRVPIGSITPIKWDAYQSSVTINQGSRITVRNNCNETPGQPF